MTEFKSIAAKDAVQRINARYRPFVVRVGNVTQRFETLDEARKFERKLKRKYDLRGLPARLRALYTR